MKHPCHKFGCYVCSPKDRMGLMWAGKKFYTADSFVREANELGVCKRIAQIPKGLVPGTPVLIAHPEGGIKTGWDEALKKSTGLDRFKSEKVPAIIYAFQVTEIEKLIRKSEATAENLAKLDKRGITPVMIPDGDPDHDPEGAKKRNGVLKLQETR